MQLRAQSQAREEEAVSGVHYTPMKGHLFRGVFRDFQGEKGWDMIVQDLGVKLFTRRYVTEADGDRCARESADITKSPCGEPAAALV